MLTAKEWLLAHGYYQFKDGTWSTGGYEADVEAVLQEYIDEAGRGEVVRREGTNETD